MIQDAANAVSILIAAILIMISAAEARFSTQAASASQTGAHPEPLFL